MQNTFNLNSSAAATAFREYKANVAVSSKLIETQETESFKQKFDELKYRDVMPVKTGSNLAIAGFNNRIYDMTGEAKIIAGYSDDLPSASTSSSEDAPTPVRMIGVSYHWNIMELAQASAVGTDMLDNRATAARLAVETKLNSVAFHGDSASGLHGLLNHPSVTLMGAPSGASGSPLWVNLTADEIVAAINAAVGAMVKDSRGRIRPDLIGIPMDQYNYIASQKVPDTNGKTVMQYLIQSSPYVEEGTIVMIPELGGDINGTGTDSMILMKKDKRYFEFKIPYIPKFQPGQVDGIAWKRPMIATTGGLVVNEPKAIVRVDGI